MHTTVIRHFYNWGGDHPDKSNSPMTPILKWGTWEPLRPPRLSTAVAVGTQSVGTTGRLPQDEEQELSSRGRLGWAEPALYGGMTYVRAHIALVAGTEWGAIAAHGLGSSHIHLWAQIQLCVTLKKKERERKLSIHNNWKTIEYLLYSLVNFIVRHSKYYKVFSHSPSFSHYFSPYYSFTIATASLNDWK